MSTSVFMATGWRRAALLAWTTVCVLSAGGGVAWAQKKKVVVEQFSGPSSDKFRQSVLTAIGKIKSADALSDKKVAGVEADLGLIQVADNYAAVAKELKASAFVGGTVTTGKKPRAKLTVRGADGSVVGTESWSQPNAAKLIAAINANIGSKLATLLDQVGGGEEKAAVAAAEKPASKKAKGAEEDEWQEDGKKSKSPGSAKSEVAKQKADEDAEGKASAEVEASASAEVSSEDAAPATSPSGHMRKGLDVAFVLRLFSRNFAYNQSVAGPQQGYRVPEEKFNNLPIVPAPGLDVNYWLHENVGVHGSFNLVVATASKDAEGSVYKTTAYSWMVGAKGRLPLGPVLLEPGVGYGSHVFKVHDFDQDPNNIRVAGVDYRHARLGTGVRLPLANGMALTAGAYYLYIMSSGEILNGDSYFYGPRPVGGEGSAGITIPLSMMKGLEARVAADIRRIAFAFDVRPGEERIAGGAVDQYVGLNLAVGYQLGN